MDSSELYVIALVWHPRQAGNCIHGTEVQHIWTDDMKKVDTAIKYGVEPGRLECKTIFNEAWIASVWKKTP